MERCKNPGLQTIKMPGLISSSALDTHDLSKLPNSFSFIRCNSEKFLLFTLQIECMIN